MSPGARTPSRHDFSPRRDRRMRRHDDSEEDEDYDRSPRTNRYRRGGLEQENERLRAELEKSKRLVVSQRLQLQKRGSKGGREDITEEPPSTLKLGRRIGRVGGALTQDTHAIIVNARSYLYDKSVNGVSWDAELQLIRDVPAGERSTEQVQRLVQHRRDERNLSHYEKILGILPNLDNLLDTSTPEQVVDYCNQLHKGVQDARGGDLSRINQSLAGWLNDLDDPPDPALLTRDRTNRGLQHKDIGRLLVSADVDWDDLRVRDRVQSFTLPAVAASLHVNLCYPDGRGDPNNVEASFLHSRLLVKAYRALFRSPKSAESYPLKEPTRNTGPIRRQGRVKKASADGLVSKRLGYERAVGGRLIAYTAVVVYFGLSAEEDWTSVCHNVDLEEIYNFIIDYFENPANDDAKDRAQATLDWWQREVWDGPIRSYGLSAAALSSVH